MDSEKRNCCAARNKNDDVEKEMNICRKGPWTRDEDEKLKHYVSVHGEGHWTALAHCAGLRRTGKSCRLRWLNYLRPNLRRGSITPWEQFLILTLHSRLGNRWSKIAQHMPGRTDNDIKNYWRTRVQKKAKKMNCEVNSNEFRRLVQHHWLPRLVEQIMASTSTTMNGLITTTTTEPRAPASTPAGPLLSADQLEAQILEKAHNHQQQNNYEDEIWPTAADDDGLYFSGPELMILGSDVRFCGNGVIAGEGDSQPETAEVIDE